MKIHVTVPIDKPNDDAYRHPVEMFVGDRRVARVQWINGPPYYHVEAVEEIPDPVGIFIEGHAKRLAELYGDAWDTLDGEAQTWWMSQIHHVLNNLVISKGGDPCLDPLVVDGRAYVTSAPRHPS